MFHKIKKIAMFLITGMLAINVVSAQTVRKVGENPGIINDKSAVLEVESTTKGILPPRMTKAQRNAIVSPVDGLQVWCTDCNNAGAVSSSGEFCVYFEGKGWTSFKMFTTPALTTDSVTKASDGSVSVNGTLVDFFGDKPSENGIVYKQITDNDFQTPPVLDASGNAGAGVYKLQSITVTAPDKPIAVNIPASNATIGGRGPYSFRTYAKNSFGIGYGKPIIFNREPPVISPPIVNAVSPPIVTYNDYGNSPSSLIFSGTLTVNAGTPKGTITEYGYCSGTNSNPTTANNKVVLSTGTAIANLDAVLSSAGLVKDFTVDLAVNNYVIRDTGKAYFRYYVIANGVTIYSDAVNFFPVDKVTRSTAVAKLDGSWSVPRFQIGKYAVKTLELTFNVKKAGEYKNFVVESLSGATKGLTIAPVLGGTFALGIQKRTFVISGTPVLSLDGNRFTISGIEDVFVIEIDDSDPNNNAICDTRTAGVDPFQIVEIRSKTGKIWLDRNLGASRRATYSSDFAAFGCFFQWGRGNDGHASVGWISATDASFSPRTYNQAELAHTDTPGSIFISALSNFYWDWRDPANDNLWQGVTGINNPCPKPYRLPTIDELTAEVNAYGIHNSADAFNSPFRFQSFGRRNAVYGNDTSGNPTNELIDRNIGYIWSSTVYGQMVYFRTFEPSGSNVIYNWRSNGQTVRCIKN